MRYFADAMLLLCTLLWGLTFSLVKDSLSETGPFLLNFLRFSGACAFLIPWSLARGGRIAISAWKRALPLALALTAGFAFQTAGLVETEAHRSAFLTQMLVLFTPFLQLALNRKRIGLGTALGIVVVLPGLYFLLSPSSVLEAGRGDFLSLACAFCFAVYIVLLDNVSQKETLTDIVQVQVYLTALFSGLIVLFSGETAPASLSWSYVGSIAYLVLATTILTTFLQSRFQKDSTPARAAVLFCMEPVFGAVFAAYLRGEQMGMRGYVGAGLVLLGVLLSELWTARKGPGSGQGKLQE